MKTLKSLNYLIIKIWVLSFFVCFSVNADSLLRQSEGIIQNIDTPNQTISISAYEYKLVADSSVFLENGSKSYIGQLKVGDKVHIKYDSKQRAIKEITVLPISHAINLK